MAAFRHRHPAGRTLPPPDASPPCRQLEIQVNRPPPTSSHLSRTEDLPDISLNAVALALVAAGAGGLLFSGIGVPLGWLLGAMFATTLASLRGLPVAMPRVVRTPVLTVLGVLIGAAFSPERISQIPHWLGSVALLGLYVPATAWVSFVYLRRFIGLARKDAYFAAMPGGLSQMILMAEEAGADMRTVALVHTVRVLTIVSVLPLLVLTTGGAGAVTSSPQSDPAGLLVSLLVGAAGAAVAGRLRLPASALFGALLASGFLHGAGLVEGTVPPFLIAAAQLLLGAFVGCGFHAMPPRRVLRYLLAGFLLTFLMFAVTFLFAGAAHLLTGLPFLSLLLAYVPGGVGEMGVVALALQIDPAFVATHHLVRIVLVVTAAPLLLRWVSPDSGR